VGLGSYEQLAPNIQTHCWASTSMGWRPPPPKAELTDAKGKRDPVARGGGGAVNVSRQSPAFHTGEGGGGLSA